MSLYDLLKVVPVNVQGKGLVAPPGYISDEARARVIAASNGQDYKPPASPQDPTTEAPKADPWGDLR